MLLPSEGELAALGLDPRELARRGVIVCETRGRDGALLFDGGDPVPVGVAPADEVDPTGAGDTFSAAFVTALRAGDAPRAAAEFACATAARTVGVLGAMEARVEPREP